MDLIRKHSLSIVLLSVFILQSIVGGFFYHRTWISEQQAHSQNTTNSSAFWNDFAGEYMISVLADTYGAVLLVILTKKLVETGSAESKKRA